MHAYLPSVTLHPSASICTSFFNYGKKRELPSAQNEGGANKKDSEQRQYARIVYNKAHEGQRANSAPVCTQGTQRDQGRRHGIFFNVRVRRKRGGTTTRIQIEKGRYSLAVRNPVSSEHDPQT